MSNETLWPTSSRNRWIPGHQIHFNAVWDIAVKSCQILKEGLKSATETQFLSAEFPSCGFQYVQQQSRKGKLAIKLSLWCMWCCNRRQLHSNIYPSTSAYPVPGLGGGIPPICHRTSYEGRTLDRSPICRRAQNYHERQFWEYKHGW